MYLSAINIELSLPKEKHLLGARNGGESFAKPELKFFLIRLIFIYGIDEIRESSVETLAKRLGVSKNTVVNGFSLLCQVGLYSKSLSKVKSSSLKGRPTCEYRPTERLKELVDEEQVDCNWEVLIEDVLGDCSTGEDGPRHPLKLANRLLLITFLRHADKYGEVTTLGYSYLHRLTGMSKQQLASQRKKLASLGYIIDYQPGGPEYAVKLVPQSKSQYSINTCHAKFPEFTTAFTKHIELINQWEMNLRLLLQAAAEIENTRQQVLRAQSDNETEQAFAESFHLNALRKFDTIVGYDNAWVCSRFFYEKFRKKLNFNTLNRMTVSYASSMLSNHWELFSERGLLCHQLKIVPSLKKQISEDFSLNGIGKPEMFQFSDLKLSNDLLVESISEVLIYNSFNLAKCVHRDLTDFVDHKPTGRVRRIRIFPMEYITPTMHLPIKVDLTEK